ncbi:MAG: glycogen-binding domain-containing protein [Spirochaetia bacterium]
MERLPTLLFITLLLTAALSQGMAEENYPPSLHVDMQTLEKAAPPEKRGQYVLFTYSSDKPTLRVGIAFAHEDFNTVHTLSRNPNDVFVLAYSYPEDLDKLVYRFVIDGRWSSDPRNPNTMETQQNVTLSCFDLPQTTEDKTRELEVSDSGEVTFYYRSSSAQNISVAGNFNSWDPYMYRLKKVPGKDNLYSITLPLPEGTYYYQFIVDGKRKPDPNNPEKVVSSSGDTVSVIQISG